MGLTESPQCEFDKQALDFNLLGVDDNYWTLANTQGEYGLLIMFICNHCPYVQAIRDVLLADVKILQEEGVGCVAIMSNDTQVYPGDSFENMKQEAERYQFTFPYLYDETQSVAKDYGAVCTPDFFGYNKDLKLQYRGRLDSRLIKEDVAGAEHELLEGMRLVVKTGKGPEIQTPSMGCSIKWR